MDFTPLFLASVLLFGSCVMWLTRKRNKSHQFIAYLKELHRTNPRLAYELYLKSPEWLAVRQTAFDYFFNRCAGCGTPHGLEGHHITYRNLFAEKLGDVIPFCRSCHARLPKSDGLYTGQPPQP